jgi:hypothetical protein
VSLTVTRLGREYIGQKRRTFGTFAFDTSYPSLGYPVTPRMLELGTLDELLVSPRQGYAFNATTGDTYEGEHVIVMWGQWTAAVDGPLHEVTAGTDLSTLTQVPWEAYGS